MSERSEDQPHHGLSSWYYGEAMEEERGLYWDGSDYLLMVLPDNLLFVGRKRGKAVVPPWVIWEIVPDLYRFVRHAKQLSRLTARIGGHEVIYLLDLADNGFGYLIDLTEPPQSKWDYFPRVGQSFC